MDDSNLTLVERAVARLTLKQRLLVGACLQALACGPYLPDWEFHTVMGASREEATAVASAWPAVAEDPTFLVVNNALNTLLGYPHGRWSELRGVLGADPQDVRDALEAWRSEEPPPAYNGSSYVDYLR